MTPEQLKALRSRVMLTSKELSTLLDYIDHLEGWLEIYKGRLASAQHRLLEPKK